jgi:hypothetical protein
VAAGDAVISTAAWENHTCVFSGDGSVRCWGGKFSAWHDNPEQLYAKKQLRELVEKELLQLPARY